MLFVAQTHSLTEIWPASLANRHIYGHIHRHPFRYGFGCFLTCSRLIPVTPLWTSTTHSPPIHQPVELQTPGCPTAAIIGGGVAGLALIVGFM
ncbi:uncharacterized protein EI90DRAFT_3086727, partial [Cantharellus anzutake]|uniref:uncharacterized protein n=1 Tax=Cantharellus anzutake TaxID=1750568 RepID=UPI001902ED51